MVKEKLNLSKDTIDVIGEGLVAPNTSDEPLRYYFGSHMPTLVKWDKIVQTIPLPDLTDVATKIEKCQENNDIDIAEVENRLKLIPDGFAYIDWEEIQVALPEDKILLIFQIPIVAFCIEEDKSNTWNPISIEFREVIVKLLTEIGYVHDNVKLYGKKPKKQFSFYRPENYPRDKDQLQEWWLQSISKHGLSSLQKVMPLEPAKGKP